MTEDGRFSVYDAIVSFKNVSSSSARELIRKYEADGKIDGFETYKFPGRGQQFTPVASFHQLLQILSQLPGEQARVLRREQAEISSRAIAGDEDLEEAIIGQRQKFSEAEQNVLMNGLERRIYRPCISIEPYLKKSVVYSLEIEPSDEIKIDAEKRLYKFGVTSDIEDRLSAHESDKMFKNVRLDRCFEMDTRHKAGRAEKHFKRMISNWDLQRTYGSKIECFVASENELENIYKEMEQYEKDNTKQILDNMNIDVMNILNQHIDTFEKMVIFNYINANLTTLGVDDLLKLVNSIPK